MVVFLAWLVLRKKIMRKEIKIVSKKVLAAFKIFISFKVFTSESLTGFLKDSHKISALRKCIKIKTDPAQHTRLISFTRPANKPGELHWIYVLVIETGSYLTKRNSR